MSPSRPSQAGDAGETVHGTLPRVPLDWGPANFQPAPPEALASPAIVWVRHDEVIGDPYNIRDSLPSVERLARSIYQHGLLENLIIRELDPERSRSTGKRYQLCAGSRRFEAIRRLITEGVAPPEGHDDRELGIVWRWPEDKLIPGLVLGSEGHYEHLLENIERSDPFPWEVGRRINEILSAGVSTRELGTRIGRSSGWVTRFSQIGRGLSPELIAILRKEPKNRAIRLGELAQLAALRDPFGDPDAERQIATYRARRERKRKRPRRIDPQGFRATIKRLQYLRGDMAVPTLLRPVVSALIDYLEGGTPPRFKTLEEQLFSDVRTRSPHVDGEGELCPS